MGSVASTKKRVGDISAPTSCLSELRLRWSADVQIRRERFGAVAYHNKVQRLMLIQSVVVTRVADLLRGKEPAWHELAPLGCDRDELEQLLIQLYKEAIVEIVEEADTLMETSVHLAEDVLG